MGIIYTYKCDCNKHKQKMKSWFFVKKNPEEMIDSQTAKTKSGNKNQELMFHLL